MGNSERAFSLAAAVRQAVGDKPLEVSGQVVQIPRDQITPNAANFYTMTDLEALATSIQLTGLIHPIIVRPAEGGGYVITDGERRFRATGILEWPTVPAIVRTPINAVLEELALIEANRQSRKLSDADLSKQAERLQELLVALKESGVEIPGRIRSAVAEAMQLSESKLARLKKIRADLVPEYLALFDVGQLNESVSYELAKLPPARQRLIAGAPGELKKKTLEQVQSLANYADETLKDRECYLGGTCKHEMKMFMHDRGQRYSWNRECSYTSCCKDCYRRTNCKDCCPILKDVIDAEKKDKQKKKDIADAEARRREDEKKAQADTDWRRMKAIREAAGIPSDDASLTDWPGLNLYKEQEKRDPEYSKTVFPDELTPYRTLKYYADLFGVSLDTLAGRETPQAAPAGAALVWHNGQAGDMPDMPEDEKIVCWGAFGLRSANAGNYARSIELWPDTYTWWAAVNPPPGIDPLAAADEPAAEPAQAPAT